MAITGVVGLVAAPVVAAVAYVIATR